MPTLTDLQQAAQGNNTLGGIKSNTGVAPSNAQTASSLGAVPNAAQMAGTPQQQKAAIKEAVGTQGTLGELQRTASGRTQAKQGQSTDALEATQAAKDLAGLGGKMLAATTNAVKASTNLPLNVVANIDTYVPPADNLTLKTELPADLKSLQDAIQSSDGAAQMKAWKTLRDKYSLSPDTVAQMFDVPAEVLWGQLESSLAGTKVTMRDMAGVADPTQIEAAKKLLPADKLADFDNLPWQDAKALISQTLNNATANVDDLKRQASDQTLPQSTRGLAMQRLRELGVTGEFQSAEAIQAEKAQLDATDNIKIGDKEYEVGDVLKSPEAKEAIISVLNGTKELKDLEGGPLAALIPIISKHADELAANFGIGVDGKQLLDKNGVPIIGKLQKVENTRSTNQKAIADKLSGLGIPVPTTTDKDVLKAIGVTDDVINGYAAFDPATLDNNQALTVIKGLSAAEQAKAWTALGTPGMAALVDGTHPELVKMLGTEDGPQTLTNISKMNEFIGKDFAEAGNEAEEVGSLFDAVGLGNLFSELQAAGDMDLSSVGVDLPDSLDANNDGKIDDAATIQKNLIASGKSLEDIKNELAALKSVTPKQVQDAVASKKLFDETSTILSETNEYDYSQQESVLGAITKLTGLGGPIKLQPKRNGIFGTKMVPIKPEGVTQKAFDTAVAQYSRLKDMASKMKSADEHDTKASIALDSPKWGGDNKVGWQDAHAEAAGNLSSAEAALASKTPAIRERAESLAKQWFAQAMSVKRVRGNENSRMILAGYLASRPEMQKLLLGRVVGNDDLSVYKAVMG